MPLTHYVGQCVQCHRSFFLSTQPDGSKLIPDHKIGTGHPPYRELCVGSQEPPVSQWKCRDADEEGRVYKPEVGPRF